MPKDSVKNMAPALVSTVPLALRQNMGKPISCSNDVICDSRAWRERNSLSAALAKLPVSRMALIRSNNVGVNILFALLS